MTEPVTFPELRPVPPWVMEDMIAAEPGLAEPIVDAVEQAEGLVDSLRDAVADGRVAVVGCGTSEHAAMGVAAELDDALRGGSTRPGTVVARQAFEASLDPWPDGLCLGISHEGATTATIEAMRAAGAAGATVGLITAVPGSAAAAVADEVVATPMVDRSWCHTVGYLSPILVGGALAGHLTGEPVEARVLIDHVEGAAAVREAVQEAAEALHGVRRVVAVGSGVDHIAARELALKVEEGARLPAVGLDLETLLHGHLVSCDATTGLVVFVCEPRDRHRRAARAAHALAAGRRIGLRTAAIVAAGVRGAWDPALTVPSPIIVPEASGISPLLSALTGSALALQFLTVGMVHREGTNPDAIRREEPRYREAAEVAESWKET